MKNEGVMIYKMCNTINRTLLVCVIYIATAGITETSAQVNYWETLQLGIVSSNDSIKELKSSEKLARKSLDKSSKIKIDTSLNYKFMFIHEKGWKEDWPNPDCRYQIDNYFIGHNDTLYSGNKLVALLGLNESKIYSNSDTTTSISRNQMLPSINQLMHPDAQNNSYLLINQGHYYPNGNQSSWMIDRFMYFEVANND